MTAELLHGTPRTIAACHPWKFDPIAHFHTKTSALHVWMIQWYWSSMVISPTQGIWMSLKWEITWSNHHLFANLHHSQASTAWSFIYRTTQALLFSGHGKLDEESFLLFNKCVQNGKHNGCCIYPSCNNAFNKCAVIHSIPTFSETMTLYLSHMIVEEKMDFLLELLRHVWHPKASAKCLFCKFQLSPLPAMRATTKTGRKGGKAIVNSSYPNLDKSRSVMSKDDDDSADEGCTYCLQHFHSDHCGEEWIQYTRCIQWAQKLCWNWCFTNVNTALTEELYSCCYSYYGPSL